MPVPGRKSPAAPPPPPLQARVPHRAPPPRPPVRVPHRAPPPRPPPPPAKVPHRGPPPPPPARVPHRLLLRAASIAIGLQFGWALQLSLLTPYVQELGIPHKWASLVWLCGPLSGLVIQPLIGHLSDRCTSPRGRRRPFIAAAAVTIVIAVLLIGFSADLGRILGDQVPAAGGRRYRAIFVFVLGFWILDVGNNAMQGPCRALLADLTGTDHRRNQVANGYFALFMALGNILGYATGSYAHWFSILPFTVTTACSVNCANLKSAFLIDIVLLAIGTYICISSVQEIPFSSGSGITESAEGTGQELNDGQEAFFWELIGAIRYLPLRVWLILIVTAITWVGWYPFILFDTDWMGREIYKGDPNEGQIYHSGVSMGALGLLLNSVVLGMTSMTLEIICRKLGSGLVWGILNIFMSLCFVAMLVISYLAKTIEFPHPGHPPKGILIAALIVFTVLGAPLSVTYIIPYGMMSARAEALGLGRGLAMGILNLAVVTPQVIVALGSGPWDSLFGGGNSPAFAVAAVAAFVSGLMAIIALPRSGSYISRTRSGRRK